MYYDQHIREFLALRTNHSEDHTCAVNTLNKIKMCRIVLDDWMLDAVQ